MAEELFDVVQSGVVKINLNQAYPLKDASNGALRPPKRARPPLRPVLTRRRHLDEEQRNCRPALSSSPTSMPGPGVTSLGGSAWPTTTRN